MEQLTPEDTCARLLQTLREEHAGLVEAATTIENTIACLEERITRQGPSEKARHERYAHMTTREAALAVLMDCADTPLTNGGILEAMENGGWCSNSNGNVASIVTRALLQLREAGEIEKTGHGRYMYMSPTTVADYLSGRGSADDDPLNSYFRSLGL